MRLTLVTRLTLTPQQTPLSVPQLGTTWFVNFNISALLEPSWAPLVTQQSLPTSSADSTPALFSTAYWAKDILPTAFFTGHPLYVPPQLCGVLSRAMHQLVLDIITICMDRISVCSKLYCNNL